MEQTKSPERIKGMEMKLKELISRSFSLGRKKFNYNNDKCLLLDGMNTREILLKDVNIGDVIKTAPKTPAIKVMSKPILEAYKFGGYKWNFQAEKVTKITDPEEE